MRNGKCRLAAAIVTLLAMPILAADAPVNTERDGDRQNPALPSQDDLIRFDNTTPVSQVTLDIMGANQKAFPLFYGAPAATSGTLIAASPSASVKPPSTAASSSPAATDGSTAAAEPAHTLAGTITKTYTSAPAFEDGTADLAEAPAQSSASSSARPTGSETGTEQAGKDSATASPFRPDQTSVASAVPHAGAGKTDDAPPTLGASVDVSARPTSPEAQSSESNLRPAGSAPVAAATAALSTSAGQKDGTDLAMSTTAAPRSSLESAPSRDKPAAPAEPAFPMTSISPPPIPSATPVPTSGNDSHPTVGLAEFKGGRALDGTPLPPPPPLPELPARPKKEVEVVKADPAQVRADFNRLKAFCEEDSLGSAAEIYAQMPDFGENEEINRLRADAANLLILGLARNDNLRAARRIFDSVPVTMTGYDANLAKTRGIINLATYYVRAERFNDAYDILIELEDIENRSALNNELFRLMARMIPYLDNADETEKAVKVYDMLLAEIKSPGTASLFVDNIQGVLKYFLHYFDRSENPVARRKRMDFLERMYASLDRLKDNPEIRLFRGTVGMSLADRYAGDPDRAAYFLEN